MTSAAESPEPRGSAVTSAVHPRGSKRAWFRVALVLAALVAVAVLRPGEKPRAVELQGFTMGTHYTIRVSQLPLGMARDELQLRIDERLSRVNRQMSTYLPDSELSQFNRWEGTDWFPVSSATARVVAAAQAISRQTEGAFDVTVGPLVNLWSFGPEARPDSPPSPQEIEQARARVDYRQLEVRQDPPALKKQDPALYVDLAAIAKGYAVDVLVDLLGNLGISGVLVEIGGDLATRGTRADGTPWRIGIERPLTWGHAIQRVIVLSDQALATSGDYRNFFEWEGRRYSHQIDPRSGRPVEHDLASVSVLAANCMLADAWATALMVVGPEQAERLAVEHDLQVLLILRTEDGFQERGVGGFEPSARPVR